MPEASLILFAARIEAAVAAYLEIRDFTNENVWRAAFEQEKVSPSFRILHGIDLTPIYSSGISQMHLALSVKGTATWICIQHLPHSLSFLMTKAISATSQRHPERNAFKYFNPFAEFPTDISGLLPREGRWWEDLGV
jgi:hypothetical protein